MFDFIIIWIVCIVSSLIRIITTLTRPVSEWIWSILYCLVIGKTETLPPITNRILLMTAQELAEKIRIGEIRAEEVMAAFIQRCKGVNPMINAIMDERYEEAMKEAIAVDHMIASGSKSESEMAAELPLLGIPFSCKDTLGVEGLLQTFGMVRQKDRKATQDSEAVNLYRNAGGIPIVVTSLPEYSMWWETKNLIIGLTRNPFNNKRTVGGSSGGEGAIITACGTVIGIGSDIAGSIRIPASFCGIYGHKPSRDLISIEGMLGERGKWDRFLCAGPMCRYVADLPMLTQILAGKNASRVPFDTVVDFRRVKIFYLEEFPGLLLSSTYDIRAAVRKAVKHFEEEFEISAIKLDIPELQYAFYIWVCKLLETEPPAFKDLLEPPITCLTWEYIKMFFGLSEHTLPALYLATMDMRSKDKFYYRCLGMYNDLKIKMEDALQGDAILLMPTHPDPPPHLLMTIPKFPNIAYTCIFNALGYPCTQIPTGKSRGMPIGIQAISTKFKDHLTLAAATELDKVFGGWINPGPGLE